MAASTLLVQLDLSGTAFGGAPTWTDVTRFVVLAAGMTVTSWRQDAQGQISPSTWSITFDNSDLPGDATAPNAGRFTPGLSTSPWSGKILPGVRNRITETVNGTAYQIADGYAIDWSAQYDEHGTFTTVVVNFQDLLGWMGTLQPLKSLVLEEMLLDAPTALYPLDEAAGSTSAGDITGKQPPATVKVSKYGAGTLTFGNASPLIGPSGTVSMSSPDSGTATAAARATYLSIPNALPATGPFAIEILVQPPGALPANPEYLFLLPASSGAAGGPGEVFVSLDPANFGQIDIGVTGSAGSLAGFFGLASSLFDGKWHHIMLTYTMGANSVATLYHNGVSLGSSSVAGDMGWKNPNTPLSLGVLLNNQKVSNPLNGSIALCAQYASTPSTARMSAHYTASLTGFAGERTDQRVSRLLSYRPNVGSVLDVGKGLAGVQSTAGVALQQALLDVAKTEGGVVYADGQGRIVFLNRGHLFNPTSAATFDAEADLETNYVARIDLQQLLNDVTISRAGGGTQRKTDSASILANGVRALSDTYIVNGDRDAADAAGWLVANFKTPKMRSPQLVVDVLTQSSLTQAQAALARAPLDRVGLTNLPTSAPPTDVMIQGRSVTIALDRFDVQFFTSQLPRNTLRADAAASAFTKLDNGLVIAW